MPHTRLLNKLSFYGVRGNTNQWIKDFLTSRTQQVVLDGATSSTADVLSGVPQGTVLGPLLFLSFINDMPEVTSSDIRLFADDSLLYRRIISSRDTSILQQDLAALERWESDWQMAFNPEKCTVMHITNRRKPLITNYRLHGHILEREQHSKYLGITISQDLKWNMHVNNITMKANRSLGFVRRNMRGCKPPVKAAAYNAIVRPTLEYAATVWDPYTIQQATSVERVQRRPARFVSNNYRDYTPGAVTGILHDLGWDSLTTRRTKSRLTMLFKIVHGLVEVPHQHLVAGDRRTRGTNKFREIAASKEAYRQSFYPRTVRQWNKLPPDITAASSVEGFKAMLDRLPAGHKAFSI